MTVSANEEEARKRVQGIVRDLAFHVERGHWPAILHCIEKIKPIAVERRDADNAVHK